MQNRIRKWNCRGLKANYEETLLLLKDYEPAALCLQETHLKATHNAPHSHLPLHTSLQAVAVSITLHRVITLYSIYIPPNSRLSPKDLDDLVPQLPSPFILLGDFNGHNIL